MLFSEKYPDQKVKEKKNEDGLVVGNIGPCLECGTPTRFLEICSEGHFCSEECLRKFYDRMNALEPYCE